MLRLPAGLLAAALLPSTLAVTTRFSTLAATASQ